MDPLDELLRWLRPSWFADALCREYPELSWYPAAGLGSRKRVEVCARCAVRAECLTAALDHVERFGVWGGVDASTRLRFAGVAA